MPKRSRSEKGHESVTVSKKARSKGKGKAIYTYNPEEDRKERVDALIEEGRLEEASKEIFGKGALEMLKNVHSHWEKITPKMSDMPKGWLEDDLSSGLDPIHLFPNFYIVNPLEGRDAWGFKVDDN